MKKIILYGLSAVMLLSLTACGQQAEQQPEQDPAPLATTTPTPEPSTTPEPSETATPEPSETASPEPSETANPEPSETVSPEPSTEQPPEETPETANPQQPVHPTPEWEEPPVMTIYNPDADTNSDGHVDKAEWEEWVANHPEDLDQDMFISEEEIAAMQDPTGEAAESIKPVTPEEWQQQQQEIVENNPNPPEQPEEGSIFDTTAEDQAWLASGGGVTAPSDFSDHEGAHQDQYGNWSIPDSRVQ